MKIKCLAVDDEPLALRLIEKYVAMVPHLELTSTCTDAIKAMEILHSENIDLLLLDINMPRISGISMLKTLEKTPWVIFTTAYPEYAVEGFELDAVDYLVKPFSFERFLKAINRVSDRIEQETPTPNIDKGHLLIKASKKLFKVEYDDILYVEAYGDYVKIYTREKKLLTKQRLSDIENELPKGVFFKIHRSFIIALQAIDFIEGNMVNIGTNKLPISQVYKSELIKIWAKND